MIRLQVLKLVFGRTELDERSNGQTDGRTDGWTDKRGSRNSYLDTLVSRIIVQVGIKVQVGKISKINKRAGWNKAMQVGILGILSL